MTEKMRAVVITSFGDVDVLEVLEVARPVAVADRVRVRVHAAALNRADLLQRRGRYPAPPGAPQDIPGLEFAGEVDQVGSEVRAWRVGQRVFGITGGGAQAEYVVVPENLLVEVPESLNWVEAAAVPEAFITSHDALFTQAGLALGERVLIHAIASGVGTAAMQLAHAAGATVYGTTRSPEKLVKLAGAGFDRAVMVNDGTGAVFANSVREWTAGGGVHVILDLVGASYLAANLDALAPRGRLVFVGTMGGANATLDLSIVMRKRLQLIGTVLRARSAEEKARAVRRFAHHVVPLLASGAVRPIIDEVFPLADVRAAHYLLESNRSIGKVVLTMNDD